jgi:hypothetical protein
MGQLLVKFDRLLLHLLMGILRAAPEMGG